MTRWISPSTPKNSPSRRKCATGSRPTCRRRWRRKAAAAAPATSPRNGCCSGRRSSRAGAGSARTGRRNMAGPGWNSTQKFIFEMEMARADSPYLSSFSIKMVAPVLMKYGSDAQKKRFLPKIAAAEELWCQGYSEPGSGSDLAQPAHQGRACRATTTSSTARRSGRPTPIGPTGSSAWCGPRTRASGRRASPSC